MYLHYLRIKGKSIIYAIILGFVISHIAAIVLANEIIVSGKLDSNAANSDKSLYIEGSQKNEEFSNNVSFKTQHSYIKYNGTTVKYRALFDYEQLSKMLFDDEFSALYIRHKNDRYKNSEYQNYTIVSIGEGFRANKYVSLELFFGKRFAAAKDIYIIRPAITLDVTVRNFRTVYQSSFIKGENYKLIKNKAKLSYQLTKRVSIQYVIDIETSNYHGNKNLEKSSTLALGIKF